VTVGGKEFTTTCATLLLEAPNFVERFGAPTEGEDRGLLAEQLQATLRSKQDWADDDTIRTECFGTAVARPDALVGKGSAPHHARRQGSLSSTAMKLTFVRSSTSFATGGWCCQPTQHLWSVAWLCAAWSRVVRRRSSL
jgi:hypothetical protein